MPELKRIPVTLIKIPDVRVSSVLDDEQRALIGSTIREVGVVQDPVVRALPDGSYELVAGKSRIQELVAQGAQEVDVKVIAADERTALIMNIIENVARGSYDYISVSKAIRKLVTLGSTYEDLEKIFPWRRRWIQFLDELQDLPDDVVQALTARIITPTHVQIALNLPTPEEIHQGLRTVIRLAWDTGTFKIYVQNRLEQIEAARRDAASQGLEPTIPAANPQALIKYKQCLLCGYQKDVKEVTLQTVCDGCRKLASYITNQEGPPEKAIFTIYAALRMYHGLPPDLGPEPEASISGVSQA